MKSALAGMYPAISLESRESKTGRGGSSDAGKERTRFPKILLYYRQLWFRMKEVYLLSWVNRAQKNIIERIRLDQDYLSCGLIYSPFPEFTIVIV